MLFQWIPVCKRRVFCWSLGIGVVRISLKNLFFTCLFNLRWLHRFGRTLGKFSVFPISTNRYYMPSPFGWLEGILHLSRIGVAAYIFWVVWVARCSATYEDSTMSSRSIWLKVTQQVSWLNILHAPQKDSTRTMVLETLGVSQKVTRIRQGLWCKWDKPNPGLFKLNLDGLAKGEDSLGGRIIRNEEGNIFAAFSHFYGVGSNNMAEFFALRDGMRLCK